MPNDTVVKLIQPGAFSDQLTDILRNGAHHRGVYSYYQKIWAKRDGRIGLELANEEFVAIQDKFNKRKRIGFPTNGTSPAGKRKRIMRDL